jgi:hypothetical protein
LDDEQALKARFNTRFAVNATQLGFEMNRAFSASVLALHGYLGRCPRLIMNAAPLALQASR